MSYNDTKQVVLLLLKEKFKKIKNMKIKTTTTETKEVEVNLPAFTKVKSIFSTSYYYVGSEDKTTRLDFYSQGIKTFSQIDNSKDAFSDGFEYISEQEYIEAHQTLVNQIKEKLNQIKLD